METFDMDLVSSFLEVDKLKYLNCSFVVFAPHIMDKQYRFRICHFLSYWMIVCKLVFDSLFNQLLQGIVLVLLLFLFDHEGLLLIFDKLVFLIKHIFQDLILTVSSL